MKLKAICEELTFTISVGTGNRDCVWLANTIVHIYGKSKHISYNYSPIYLLSGTSQEVPHPRSRIKDVFKDGDEVHITIKKPNQDLDGDQKLWWEQAFGKLRNFTRIKYQFVGNKADFKSLESQFVVKIQYRIFKEIEQETSIKSGEHTVILEKSTENKDVAIFSGEISLPFGDILKYELYENYTLNLDQVIHESRKFPHNPDISQYIEPIPYSLSKLLALDKEEIEKEQEMHVMNKEELNQSIPEIEKGACPFNIDQVWKLTDWSWLPKTMQPDKLKQILNLEIPRIYEIFNHFVNIHDQSTRAKDELIVTYQDLMFILKFYEFATGNDFIHTFLSRYDSERGKNLSAETSVDIKNGVKFPDFLAFLSKAVIHLQELNQNTSNYELAIGNAIEKMLTIHTDEENLTELHRHLLFSDGLLEIIQANIQVIKTTFLNKLVDSIQASEEKYYLLKTEIITLIKETGFTGGNIEDIVDACWNDIMPGKKYDNFEGIYFYEFIQVLMWLSIVFIQKNEDEQEVKQQENADLEVSEDLLLEKFRFLLEMLASLLANQLGQFEMRSKKKTKNNMGFFDFKISI